MAAEQRASNWQQITKNLYVCINF